MVHPAHDGCVSQRQVAFRHHLHQVAVAELETQIPSHAKDDDLPVKVAALEQIIQTQEPGHRATFSSSEGSNMGGRTVCTRARSFIQIIASNARNLAASIETSSWRAVIP